MSFDSLFAVVVVVAILIIVVVGLFSKSNKKKKTKANLAKIPTMDVSEEITKEVIESKVD